MIKNYSITLLKIANFYLCRLLCLRHFQMKSKSPFLFFVLVLLSTMGFAQNKILMVKQKGKYYFEVQGKDAVRLDEKKSLTSIIDILASYPEASEYAQKARSNYDIGITLGFIGGGLVGWELGKVIGGREINGVVFGSGLAIALVTIPLTSGFKNNINAAIGIYNKKSNEPVETTLNLGLQQHGIGMSFYF
ncbi:hypothetical protein [Ekhidna sp.]